MFGENKHNPHSVEDKLLSLQWEESFLFGGVSSIVYFTSKFPFAIIIRVPRVKHTATGPFDLPCLY